ncbi:Protein of unknown function [Cotesia congregata]|uniref:Uncharacterized protein n=1 Tax=Cotesia congregata TaxID=51543 RepID=A0A8J2HEW9_COTCN|nr:Protein of unknown function [Cotesia congregata]
MYPWYRESVAAAAAAGLGGPVGVVGSGFCSTAPGQGATTIKTESGYSDCMLALDYVQSKVDWDCIQLGLMGTLLCSVKNLLEVNYRFTKKVVEVAVFFFFFNREVRR